MLWKCSYILYVLLSAFLFCFSSLANGQTLPPEEWKWTIVDGLPEVDNGVSPSVGLNGQGQVTVAFYNWVLNYAILTDTGWLKETADSGGQHGINPSLAYDSQGIPHITYEAMPSFYYATRDASTGTWTSEYVSTYGVFNDLVIDSSDRPHASFVGWFSNPLFYATKVGQEWLVEEIDRSVFYYNSTGIALDSEGLPHIVYTASAEVRHAFKDESGWHVESIVSGTGVGRGPSICIDKNDNIHVSVFDDGNTNLLYANKKAGSWSVSVIDTEARSEGHDWHARTAIALLHGGSPVVAYYNTMLGELRFGLFSGETWDIQVIEASWGVGKTPSMVIGNNGSPYIAYHDDIRDIFKIAYVTTEPYIPPVANADGPYTIYVNDTLTLDGSGSIDDDNDIVSYMWDLDDDGTFETDAKDQAVFDVNYTYLQSLGLLVNNTYNIYLQVTDSQGQSDTNDTNLTILPKPALEVAVDIKPGSCPNPLNVKSQGVLPVAVLGSEDFDENSIDIASIRLAGVAPIRSSFEDVGTPLVDANECECYAEGPDGFPDLILKFETQMIVDAIGEVNHGDELVLQLTGVLFNERPIEGSDCVIIRGSHKPIKQADINKDGVVNAADFAIFSQNWLQSSIADE